MLVEHQHHRSIQYQENVQMYRFPNPPKQPHLDLNHISFQQIIASRLTFVSNSKVRLYYKLQNNMKWSHTLKTSFQMWARRGMPYWKKHKQGMRYPLLSLLAHSRWLKVFNQNEMGWVLPSFGHIFMSLWRGICCKRRDTKALNIWLAPILRF